MVLRVLIYEFVTGGGYLDSPGLPAILSEGYAMLNSLLKDFSQNAGCNVLTVMDKRVSENSEPLAADKIYKVSSGRELNSVFKSASSEVDAALIVAPETDGILATLTETAEDCGCRFLLGSNSKALRQVSNKKNAIEIAGSADVAVPETMSTSADESEETVYRIARDIGLPVVIKPQEGAGCEGVFVVNNRQDLSRALKNLGADHNNRRLLLQEYIRGVDASISVVSSKSRHAVPLSMNRQLIELKPPQEASSYEGGYTPFDHPLKQKTLDYARKIVESVEGLKGYVGVDFVLTEEKPVFMEVNARITASYAGLYRVLQIEGRKGAANAIINAAMNDELPSHLEVNGCAYYSKFHLKPDIRINKDMIDVLSNLEYVESPPLSDRGGTKEAFLVSEGNSLNEALEAKSRNEKKLDKIARRFMGPSPRE